MNTDSCTFAKKYIDFCHRYERFGPKSRKRYTGTDCAFGIKMQTVEAGGVGISRPIENTQVIDFFDTPKTQDTAKLRPTGR